MNSGQEHVNELKYSLYKTAEIFNYAKTHANQDPGKQSESIIEGY